MPRRLILFAIAIVLVGSAATAADNAGFLYGTLTLENGDTVTGFLRWESEEAYWDDIFHSRQVDAAFFDHVDMKVLFNERKKKYFAEHGLVDRLMWTMSNREDDDKPRRLFICRFGDLTAISQDDDENVTVTLNDGRRVAVHGYANDVSSDILVYTGAEGPEIVEWDDMRRIDFAQAPAQASPYAERIYAEVDTRSGHHFEGFLMWDESECTSIDIIDADEQDVPLGDIRRMVKRDEGGSEATIDSGEVLILTGTNDVDRGHRGVFVEVVGVGRVNVDWKDFDDADFHLGRGSGAGREDFAPITELRGIVTDIDGATWTGRVVWDLDEGWTCDIFNGEADKWEYDIPFANIATIEKRDEQTCRLDLRGGEDVVLSGGQDTGENHAGLLIFEYGEPEPAYIPWSRFARVVFDRQPAVDTPDSP